MTIRVEKVSKRFGSVPVLNEVSLEFRPGELVALLGPSGCGKTTLLRIVAGLERADEGRVFLDGEDASETHVRDRNVGFVFQHYALFRHMTVFENVAFGLKVRPRHARPAAAEIRRKVHELLSLVQLDIFADRYPEQLSGGQRQRVALARALAVEPKVLLLDEPFGALDAKVRKELRRWLRRLHDELHITSIFVTHDQEEALEVADRVVVMNRGRIEQMGSPAEVYDHPATPFVYGFLGTVNLFHGRVHGDSLKIGESQVPLEGIAPEHGSDAVGFVRPHEIEIVGEGSEEGIPARVSRVLSAGPVVRVELCGAGGTDESHCFEVELDRGRLRSLALSEGQVVRLRPHRMRAFHIDSVRQAL